MVHVGIGHVVYQRRHDGAISHSPEALDFRGSSFSSSIAMVVVVVVVVVVYQRS